MIRKDLTDHQFAAYLRQQNAINNYEIIGHTTVWKNDSDIVVAMVIYLNGNEKLATFVLA